MNDVIISAAACTDTGRRRSANEDAFMIADLSDVGGLNRVPPSQRFSVSRAGVLLAVSDGMGGHRAGDVASLVALDSLHAALTDAAGEPSEKKLEAAILSAHAAVIEAARHKNRKGMGATLTVVLITPKEALIAEVGDSRAYLLRGGKLRRLTRDQSLVQMLVDAGALSPEEAKDSPRRNIVLQAMGTQRGICVALGRLQLRRGDKILVCSDGIWEAITDQEIARILARPGTASAAVTLIDLANERGGVDNLTAVVAELTGNDLIPLGRTETLSGTFEVIQEYTG